MSPTELLDHLDAAGVTLALDAGRIRLTGRRSATHSPEVAAAITAHRDVLLWHLRGRATGHALAPCSTCGEPSMTHYRHKNWPRCRLTPGCPGEHKVRPADLNLLTGLRAPKAPTVGNPPERPPKRRLLGPWPIYPTPAAPAGTPQGEAP